MRRMLTCLFKGHCWTAPYYHGGTFRRCRRCGKIGWEMPT